MNTKLIWIALLLLGALLLAGCSSKVVSAPVVPEGAQAGELTPLEPCEFQPAGSKAKYGAECGTLVVPENWDKAGSRLTALPVVRIPAGGPNPAEPVFWLVGGPGGPNLSWEPPDWLLANHDVVMVGYRGVDGTVVLSCPDLSRLFKTHLGKDLFSTPARAEYTSAVKQCAATHQEAGVDLTGYSIPGVVEDMEAARKALGYDRINLFSESYGTRVAQIYAYMHPDSLHRLVLIGVNTPGHFIYDPAVLDEMIRQLNELCAQDETCSSRTDDLARTIYEVNHNMPKRWLAFNIDPDTIRLGAHFLLFANSDMTMIFDAYLAAAEGDPSGLALTNLMARVMFPADRLVFGDTLSKGGTADLETYGGIESISLGNSIMGAPHSELIWAVAAAWPIELIPQELRGFQESDVEMLLVNGAVDFSTPPNALDKAKPYFHKAQMVLLPEFSHVSDEYTLQPAAFERLITSYYDTGVADDSLYVYQPLSFAPRLSLTVIAKLLVAAMLLLSALVILGVVLGVRRLRRRRTILMTKRAFAASMTMMLALVILLSNVGTATAQAKAPQAQTIPGKNAPAAASPQQGPTDPAELETFLDGLLEQEMEERHIAGAAVSKENNSDNSHTITKHYPESDEPHSGGTNGAIHAPPDSRYLGAGRLPDGAAELGSRSRHHPLQPAASWHHLLAVDDRRHGMAVCRVAGDHLLRARHAALERHPPASLAANPARSQNGPAKSKAVLVAAACLVLLCPGECRADWLSECAHGLAVSGAAASSVHGYRSTC